MYYVPMLMYKTTITRIGNEPCNALQECYY